MMRLGLLVTSGLLVSLLANVAVIAQTHQGTQQEQSACSRDAQRFCRNDLGNDSAVQPCLQMQKDKLSAGCKKVFDSRGM
jgi:hypothetical protein